MSGGHAEGAQRTPRAAATLSALWPPVERHLVAGEALAGAPVDDGVGRHVEHAAGAERHDARHARASPRARQIASPQGTTAQSPSVWRWNALPLARA